MRTIVFGNYKGGTGKSTSAVFTAHGLVARGYRVAFIDADTSRRTGTATIWCEVAGFPFLMIGGLAGPRMHQRLAGNVPENVDVLVIDTPPMEEDAGVVMSALRAADDVVIPLAPTMADLDDPPRMWMSVDALEGLRDTLPRVAHLFTAAPPHPRSVATRTYRQMLEDAGRWVLRDRIPFGDLYAQARGFPVTSLGAYEGVVDELTEGWSDGE